MPIYNAGKDLRLAVLSIVRQTFTDWELLIIDDGSTDDAIDSILYINDKRIRIIRDGLNMGLAARLNQAIDMALGKYFARMDQDDVSYPDRFSKQLDALRQDDSLDLVAVRTIAISSNNQMLGMRPYALTNKQICARPWQGFYLPHPTWMGKIEWFKHYRYAEPAHYFSEDQELLLRSHQHSNFATIPEVLFAYRVRDKPNRSKLYKIRLAVFYWQVLHFIASRQPHFILLAFFTLLGRMFVDLLNLKAWMYTRNDRSYVAAASSNWVHVLDYLQEQRQNAGMQQTIRNI
jgi:glycosyltransferase involved in cell wall biosynthesis